MTTKLLIGLRGFGADGYFKSYFLSRLPLCTLVALFLATAAVAQTVEANAEGALSLQLTPQAYVSERCRASGINIADGQSHLLSSCNYKDLDDAKKDYSFATALDSEVAWAAHQKGLRHLQPTSRTGLKQ